MASPIIKNYRTIGEDVAFKMVAVPRNHGVRDCGQTVYFDKSTGHVFRRKVVKRPSDRFHVKSILGINPSDGRKSRTDGVCKVYATLRSILQQKRNEQRVFKYHLRYFIKSRKFYLANR